MTKCDSCNGRRETRSVGSGLNLCAPCVVKCGETLRRKGPRKGNGTHYLFITPAVKKWARATVAAAEATKLPLPSETAPETEPEAVAGILKA